MFIQLNSVIVDADTSNRQVLAQFLSQFGVNLVADLPSMETLPQLLGRSDAPQLVIINLDPNAQNMLKDVGNLPRQFPATSFFLMSQTLDAQLLMSAMQLGVREFIPLPINQETFAAAVDRVAQQHGLG